MIHVKNLKRKISWSVPLNIVTDVQKPLPVKWIKWRGGKLYLEESWALLHKRGMNNVVFIFPERINVAFSVPKSVNNMWRV